MSAAVSASLSTAPTVEASQWSRFAAYWKGIGPALLLCSNPAINYTVYDSLRAKWTTPDTTLATLPSFLLGITAKFVATMATYPLIRAKVLLMVTSRSETQTLWQALQQARREGGLYRGCRLQLLHTLLKSACLMVIREHISSTTHKLIAGKASV